MKGKTLMIQGTASSVGKSILVTALCRVFRQDGLDVAPFKALNMTSNSFVTKDGAEMGAAQVIQAAAAGVPPDARMNPVLLMPKAGGRCGVVLMGKRWIEAGPGDFDRNRERIWRLVTDSLDALRESHDLVVVEGAGSPAEPNLKHKDIVNMAVARYCGSPVVLVADIDRGGAFAHLLGTCEILDPEEREMVRAFVLNRYRGDPEALTPAVRFLRERTGIELAGIIPYIGELSIPEEDASPVDAGSFPDEAEFDKLAEVVRRSLNMELVYELL